jgi:hypothetical protein
VRACVRIHTYVHTLDRETDRWAYNREIRVLIASNLQVCVCIHIHTCIRPPRAIINGSKRHTHPLQQKLHSMFSPLSLRVIRMLVVIGKICCPSARFRVSMGVCCLRAPVLRSRTIGRQSIGRHMFSAHASQSGANERAMLNDDFVSRYTSHMQKQETLLRFVMTLQTSGRHERVHPNRATFFHKHRRMNDDQSKSPMIAGENVIHQESIVPVPTCRSRDTAARRRRPEWIVNANKAFVA